MTAILASVLGRTRTAGRRLLDLIGPTGIAARQSLVALTLNSLTSLVAGAALGAITGTLEALPGLLVMVPAAIGLRGNIAGSLGNRISTSIHTGTYRASLRSDSVVGANLAAAVALTFVLSLGLAVVARLVATAFNVEGAIGVLDLAIVSVAGGLLASVVVIGATIGLTAVGVRRGWDLDALVAPTTATLGDVVTIPALWIATFLLGHGSLTTTFGWTLIALSVAVFVSALRARVAEITLIIRESLPILSAAVVLSTLSGLVIQERIGSFAALPALLVLLPAFVSSAGSLGGILASRIGTNLHLGLVEPTLVPGVEARRDGLAVFTLFVPVFLINAVGAWIVAALLHLASPGIWEMVLSSLIGGAMAVAFVVALAYYGTVVAWRSDLDPDSYGIPVVTASVDLVGAIALILTLGVLGII
ncbi:MAG: magnesium transporter [Actinomycetota bacterium]